MKFNNISEIFTSLKNKAIKSGFLQHKANEVDLSANLFLDDFSKEHDMTAHTISPNRWYFQSKTHMYEDGVIELQCPSHARMKSGYSHFEYIDVSLAKITTKR